MFRTAATKIAHNSTIPALAGNQDLRPLQDLITAEKAVLISLQKLSVDFSKAAEALRTWGLNEGDDLGDILSGSTTLLGHFSSALSQYASHGHSMRDQLKAIRTREEALEELKRRRRTVVRKAEDAEKKLSKMSPEHKNLGTQTELLNRLRDEIRSMDSEIMTEEASLGDFKRTATRACIGLKFGGLLECSEKGAIIAEFGKMLISEISEEVTQPGLPRSMYYGHSKTESIVADAHRCINEVVLSTVPSSGIRERQQYTQQAAPQIPAQGFGGPGESYGPSSAPLSPIESKPQPPYPVQFTESENPQSAQVYANQNDTPRSPLMNSGPSFPSNSYPSQHQQEYTGLSTFSQPKLELLPQIMDDFGVNTRSPGMSDASNPPGGRFATFPVKNPGYSLHDPPRQADQEEKSFSASIAEALDVQGSSASALISDRSLNHQTSTAPWEVKSNETATSISSVSTSPLPPPPPGAAPPDLSKSWSNPNIEQPTQKGHKSSLSGDNIDDALLAYMTNAEVDNDQHTEEGPSNNGKGALGVPEHEDEQHRVSRHVRFGEVEDAEEHREKKISLEKERQANKDNADEAPSSPTTQTPRDESPTSHKRVPPPVFQPDEDEKSLDAAAAREVAREMAALNITPPNQGDSYQTQTQGSPADADNGRSLPSLPQEAYTPQSPNQAQREPSPLLPPAAPFAARSVSPRPYTDVNSTPPTLYTNTQFSPSQSYAQPSYPSPAQAYAQSYQGSPYTQSPVGDASVPPRFQTLNRPTENVVPPRFQGAMSAGSQVPPRFQTGGSPQIPPPTMNLPEIQDDAPRSPSTWKPDGSGSTPYRTPPEYPRQLGSGSPFARSNASLNASVPGTPLSGPRTISAAAFKRPQRNASADHQGTSGEFMKRTLPSSPYPDRNQATGGVGAQQQPSFASNDNEDDQYDYINAYVNNSNPSSPQKDSFGPGAAAAGGRPGGGYETGSSLR
ncbi:hypothetical protein D9613_012300 [Agrocybe pediades]|uniref:Eisosome component PIL1-domain-containing protein n=1 Tax=Agrocybe pediades TaxID=84607 RepID=A0A8H4VIT6_9AGAR|nr:hypothetical protein D9613_012300 [Agrocybe pediades]